ncbi:hydrolase [Thauera sp. UPWRP]|nr:hydrolase [Thauera sp. UPWRP]
MQRRIIHFGGGLAVAVALASGAQAEPFSPSNAAARTPVATQTATQAATASEQSKPQPLPVYRSPLSEYRPYRVDEPLRSWKDVNDEAGRLGGHMGQLTPPSRGDDSKGDER